MKSDIYFFLEHSQSLLQQYRSITVMFQTGLIAIAICIFTYIGGMKAESIPFLYVLSYLALCVIGIYSLVGMAKACWIRSLYVDALQNVIYAVEKGEIQVREDTPWFTLMKYVQTHKRPVDGFDEVLAIIDETRKSYVSLSRGHTRITMTYVFHGTFFLAWLFFSVDCITTLLRYFQIL